MASSFDFVSETSNLPQYSSVPQKYIQAPLTSNAGANIGVQNNNIESSNDNNSYYSKFKPIDTDSNNSPMPVEKPSSSIEVSSNTHHRARKKETTDSNDIVKADPGSTSVEDTSTINSYFETSTMLTNAMNQIDIVAGEIKQELDTVIGNRTMHNKYNTVVGLADNLGNLLNAKVGAIKELNNCISKSNDHSDNVQFGGHNIEEGICVGSNVIFNDGSIFSLDGIEQKSLVIDKQILIIDLYNRLNVNNRRN